MNTKLLANRKTLNIPKSTIWIRKRITHRTFRNIGYLTLANVLAQLISLVGAMYIPRLLGTEKYGIYQSVIAYVTIFKIVTFSGLNKVILRESARNLDKVQAILEATIGLTHLFSLFAMIISSLIAFIIDYESGTKIFIIIFSISLWFGAMDSTFTTIYQANEKMKYMAVLSILKPLLIVPLSILFLYLGFDVLALIIINLLVTGFVLIINYLISRKFVNFKVLRKAVFLKEYITQGFRFSIIGFLNQLSGRIDIVMLSILTTPQNVGIYALAYRLVEKGLIVKKNLITSVFPYYIKNTHKLNFKSVIKHTFYITLPAVIVALIISLFSEFFISNLIGKEYLQSGKILNILIMFLITHYAILPSSLFIQSTNNETFMIYSNTVRAILNIILNLVLFNFFGIFGIAYSTLICGIINLLLLLYISFVLSKNINKYNYKK